MKRFCPAKINLFLGVLGPRKDGFHELLSVVVPLDFGDTLHFNALPGGSSRVTCTRSDVPLGPDNLCLRALEAFETATGLQTGSWHLHLDKRIPPGSGLGGGSSNAAGVLLHFNARHGQPLSPGALHALALELGSDVPLFLKNGPQLLKGRGDILEPLNPVWARRLEVRPVALFLPGIPVSTPSAFASLRSAQAYLPASEAPQLLEACLEHHLQGAQAPAGLAAFNSFQKTVFDQHPELAALDAWARTTLGRALQLSGSGSACFVFDVDSCPAPPLGRVVCVRASGSRDRK